VGSVSPALPTFKSPYDVPDFAVTHLRFASVVAQIDAAPHRKSLLISGRSIERIQVLLCRKNPLIFLHLTNRSRHGCAF
jgi:hypothetical protein